MGVGGGEEVGVAAVLEFEFLRSWATVRGKLRTAMLACVRPANSCFSSFLFMVAMDSMANDLHGKSAIGSAATNRWLFGLM